MKVRYQNVDSRWGSSMFLGGICFIALYRGNLQATLRSLSIY